MTHSLPYTINRWSRLLHYLRYVAMPSADKTNWLLTLAKHDHVYAKIITTLETYGYEIDHHFFGHNGAYLPATVQIEEACVVEDVIGAHHADGQIYANFSFSSRFGGAQISHYFLHELMHFWQDYHGLFLTPLIEKDTVPIMLDAASHIAVTCLCEAMAETEALRASWRLKENGHPIAWQGARASLDWKNHACDYAADIKTMSEPEAARRAFDRWYQSRQRPYYEKRAWQSYQQLINELATDDAAALNRQLRSIDLDQLVQTLPTSEQPDYLKLPDQPSLNDALYRTITHNRTAQQLHRFENQYGACTNPNFAEIIHGAAPYLWHSSQSTAHRG